MGYTQKKQLKECQKLHEGAIEHTDSDQEKMKYRARLGALCVIGGKMFDLECQIYNEDLNNEEGTGLC